MGLLCTPRLVLEPGEDQLSSSELLRGPASFPVPNKTASVFPLSCSLALPGRQEHFPAPCPACSHPIPSDPSQQHSTHLDGGRQDQESWGTAPFCEPHKHQGPSHEGTGSTGKASVLPKILPKAQGMEISELGGRDTVNKWGRAKANSSAPCCQTPDAFSIRRGQ